MSLPRSSGIHYNLQIYNIHLNNKLLVQYYNSKKYVNCFYNEYIKLSIYDINGRVVDVLQQGNVSAGYYQVVWNADRFSSGVYFIVLTASTYKITQKIILLK